MHYGSGTDVTRARQASGQLADAASYADAVHSSDGSTFLREMTSWPAAILKV